LELTCKFGQTFFFGCCWDFCYGPGLLLPVVPFPLAFNFCQFPGILPVDAAPGENRGRTRLSQRLKQFDFFPIHIRPDQNISSPRAAGFGWFSYKCIICNMRTIKRPPRRIKTCDMTEFAILPTGCAVSENQRGFVGSFRNYRFGSRASKVNYFAHINYFMRF